MNILIIGQSNGVRLAGAGESALSSLLSASLGEPISIINASIGGCGVVAEGPGGRWLDDDVYQSMLSRVGDSPIDLIIWMGGETDAINGVSGEDHINGMSELWAALRQDFGDVPVYLRPLTLRPDVFGEIRKAQIAYAEGDYLTHIVEPPHNLGSFDLNHFHKVSYSVIGDSFARAILNDLSVTPAWLPTYGTEAADTVHGSLTDDRIYAGAGSDLVCGKRGADVVLGESGHDSIQGGPGADAISGGGGLDFITGGIDNDALFGDTGADTLRGGDGNDTLHGGAGSDLMLGDAGADIFYVSEGDRVVGFATGEDSIAVKHTMINEVTYLGGSLMHGDTLLAIIAGAPDIGDLLFY